MPRIASILLCLVWLGSVFGAAVTVNPDGSADCVDLSEAIEIADSGDTIVLADATYTGPGNRNLSFLDKTLTIQSEQGPENCILDCEFQDRLLYLSNNNPVTLRGLTIKNAYGQEGSAVYVYRTPLTLQRCVFVGNVTTSQGGAIYLYYASCTIQDCWFVDNTSLNSEGGAAYIGYDSDVSLDHCRFFKNTSGSNGGAVYARSDMAMTGCSFVGNTCASGGGAVYLSNCNGRVADCVFQGNETPYMGGGVYCYYASPQILNCTFNANVAERGAGLAVSYNTSPTVANCIFSRNSSHGVYLQSASSTPNIDHCLFFDNADGHVFNDRDNNAYNIGSLNDQPFAQNNITGTPAYAFDQDLHVIGSGAGIDQGSTEWLLSPVDLDGRPRSQDGQGDSLAIPDMGAYEYADTQSLLAVSRPYVELTYDVSDPNAADAATLDLRSIGPNSTSWHASTRCPWLKVTPDQGVAGGQPEQVSVNIHPEGISRGTHIGLLSFEGADNPVIIPVLLHVRGTLVVPDQFASIQKAVNIAMAGETLEIRAGTYEESIDLIKPLSILGIDGPIISSANTARYTVRLSAPGCTLQGLTLTHGQYGLLVRSSENLIEHCTMQANTVGIGLENEAQNNSLIHNTIQDNTGTGISLDGAPNNTCLSNTLLNQPVHLDVQGTTVDQYRQSIDTTNTADDKPIYYLIETTDQVITTIQNPACVYLIDCTDMAVYGTTLSNNSCGVCIVGGHGNTIRKVHSENNAQAGIYILESEGNTLRNNTCQNNGLGIALVNAPAHQLRDNTLANNTYNFWCQEDFDQDIDTSNTVNGKKIYFLTDESNLTLDQTSNAGCVFAIHCNQLTLTGLALENNSHGLCLIKTRDTTVSLTQASENGLFGLCAVDCSNISTLWCELQYNHTGYSAESSENMTIDNTRIGRNTVMGVICSDSQLQLANSILSHNRAGGITFQGNSDATIHQSTITFNGTYASYAYYGSGIVECGSGDLIVHNSILWHNANLQLPSYIYGNLDLTYCCIQEVFEGTGNITSDPLLTVDSHLTSQSPCIDTGLTPNRRAQYAKMPDIDSEARIYLTSIDMGADEFVDQDGDGLPDWYERYGDPNATALAPLGDPDQDGLTNQMEYELYGSDPLVPSNTFYVNADTGQDTYVGLSPDSPLQTVTTAIALCQSSDRLILAPGVYHETIDPQGRNIIIQSENPQDAACVESTLTGPAVFSKGEQRGCTLSGLTLVGSNARTVTCRTANPTLRHCIITSTPGSYYGGISCESGSPRIQHCTISGNYASYSGTVYYSQSQARLDHCLIVGNRGYDGAGVYLDNSQVSINNCTIADNGDTQPAFDNYGTSIYVNESSLTVNNSILHNWLRTEIGGYNSTVELSYCNIHDPENTLSLEWSGHVITRHDPGFVESGTWLRDADYNYLWQQGEYHLKSQGWRWSPYESHGTHWTWDGQTSLCIDAGNPGLGIQQETTLIPQDPNQAWGKNVRVNLGAYGGTPRASLAPPGWAYAGDITSDGFVDWLDLAYLSDTYLSQGIAHPGDLDSDHRINLADFAKLAQDWGQATTWFGTTALPLSHQPSVPAETDDGTAPPSAGAVIGGRR